MDVALAQVAALVANGNAWLAGDTEAAARVEQGTTFKFVRVVRFERQEGQPPIAVEAAADVAGWFGQCRARGVTAFWMDHRPLAAPMLPPHMAAAFANGSKSSVIVEGVEPRERWIATWSIDRAPTETDKRVWTVECIGRPDIANLAPRRSIAEVAAGLETTVRSVRDAAVRWGLTYWVGVFDRALAKAASDDPQVSYHVDVLPPTAELDRRRLFALAVTSFVFGGMGTWNDLGPPTKEDVPEYDRLTEALYAGVLEGVATAVNPAT